MPASLEQLEQRVAALEQGGRVVPDTFAPSAGQVIDAQGRVTYDFEGHVHARGLDLDSGTVATPPDDNKVRWLRTSDGSVAAEIYGFNNPGATGFIVARGRGAGQVAGARLEALDVASNLLARVEAIRDPLAAGFPEGRVDALVDDDTGAVLHARTILDGAGKSNFLQVTDDVGLGDPVALGLDVGVTNFTFAASAISNTIAIAHNLGRPPQVVVGAGLAASGNNTVPVFFGATNTQFSMALRAFVALNFAGTYPFAWIAIG